MNFFYKWEYIWGCELPNIYFLPRCSSIGIFIWRYCINLWRDVNNWGLVLWRKIRADIILILWGCQYAYNMMTLIDVMCHWQSLVTTMVCVAFGGSWMSWCVLFTIIISLTLASCDQQNIGCFSYFMHLKMYVEISSTSFLFLFSAFMSLSRKRVNTFNWFRELSP
jgi:hypothetical protein